MKLADMIADPESSVHYHQTTKQSELADLLFQDYLNNRESHNELQRLYQETRPDYIPSITESIDLKRRTYLPTCTLSRAKALQRRSLMYTHLPMQTDGLQSGTRARVVVGRKKSPLKSKKAHPNIVRWWRDTKVVIWRRSLAFSNLKDAGEQYTLFVTTQEDELSRKEK